ncbi:MAG: dihydropteroate synthase [Alistipes sp.]|nr:dihydropteroate synthase [Alistipes sp.]
MLIGGRNFDTEHGMYIMGILNVTPDSFSDGGKWNRMDAALAHTEEMIAQGADIIDIGGESTRPGHTPVSESEEIERITPYVEKIKAAFDIPVSVDTYKPAVCEAALKAGADLVNDIWGLKYDGKMAELIVSYDVPCCLMHNRKEAVYQNFVEDVLKDLEETLDIAKKARIPKENIILDPGVGFGKTYEQNLMMIGHLERLLKFNCPILLGTSRKSVIGLTLNVPPEERIVGTVATTVIGAMKGCTFFRVHDCLENRQALKMAGAVLGKGDGNGLYFD